MTEYFGGQREVEPCPCLPVEFRLGIRIKFSVRKLPRFGCFRSVPVDCPHESIIAYVLRGQSTTALKPPIDV